MKLQLSGVLQEKPKLRSGETAREWEYDKYITVIDVAGIRCYEANSEIDLLTSNFWGWILSYLYTASCPNCHVFTNPSGAKTGFQNCYPVTRIKARIRYGTGTDPPAFTDYKLVSEKGWVEGTAVHGQRSDCNRVSVTGAIPESVDVAIKEVGLLTSLTCGASGSDALIARDVGSWTGGSVVMYIIDFYKPWAYPISRLVYGGLRYVSVENTDVNGNMFLTTQSTYTSPPVAKIVASTSEVTWSPSLYSIPNAFALQTYAGTVSDNPIRWLQLVGTHTPTSDITVNTIGVYQDVRDVNNNWRTIAIMIKDLTTPITFYANKVNTVVIRVVAF